MWFEFKGLMLCGSNSMDECYVARIIGMKGGDGRRQKETEGDRRKRKETERERREET